MAKAIGKTEKLFSKIRDGASLSAQEEIELAVRLSVPAIFAQMSFVVMQYIDSAMVGHLGEVPAAAVALVITSIWFMWGVTASVVTPYAVQVAHKIGAKDFDGARAILRQALVSGLVCGVLTAVTGAVISPYLPKWVGGNPDLYADASAYFLIFALGMPFIIQNFIAASMLRSTGNVQLPSLVNIGMCFLDVLFNALLIFPSSTYSILGFSVWVPGADLGAAGAALGSVLAETLCGIVMMVFLLIRNDKIALWKHPGRFALTAEVTKRSANIGLPMLGERCAMTLAQLATTVIVAPLGNIALAAHSFAITAESLCYMPGFGIADAASTLVGQSYGAKRKVLAKKFAWLNIGLAIGIMSILGVVMYVWAPGMIRLMSPIDAIVDLGARCLRIQAFAEPFFAAAIVSYSIFVALGRSAGASLVNFAFMWAVRLPIAFLLSRSFGLIGVWIAMALEITLRGSTFLYRLKLTDLTRLNASRLSGRSKDSELPKSSG